ncbi:hypothetical protein IAQ61_003176 [Plenodomus lingam]|uniref:uncharacterized protein n=1 Tax=Leptosphaeria maculans TaxID=5022 RepID=UPI00332EBD18|nr:hypothetical protein IAQ61_003176 [Plenodomus lingam]
MSLVDATGCDDSDAMRIFHADGRIENALQPPEYYAYSPSPPHSDAWDDGLQAIEQFNWRVCDEPGLADPTTEATTSKTGVISTPQHHKSARLPESRARLDTVDSITASDDHEKASVTHQITSDIQQETAIPPSSIQQILLENEAETQTTYIASDSPSPPGIKSPERPNVKISDALASHEVSVAQPRGKGTEYDFSDKNNEQEATSNGNPIAAGIAESPLLQGEPRVLGPRVGGSDAVEHPGDEELCREMQGVSIERHQNNALKEVHCAPTEKAAGVPSDSSQQQSPPGVLDAPTAASDRNECGGAGENQQLQASSPDTVHTSTNVVYSPLAGEDTPGNIIIEEGVWKSQLREAAAEVVPVAISKLSLRPYTFNEVAMDNARESPEVKKQPQDMSSGMEGVEIPVNEADGGSKAQETELADATNSTVELSRPSSSIVPTASTGATRKRKKPAEEAEKMPDSEEEALEKKKARILVPEEDDAMDEDIRAGTQDQGEDTPQISDKGDSKALNLLEYEDKSTEYDELNKVKGSSTPSRPNRFAYGKQASPVKNLQALYPPSPKHLVKQTADAQSAVKEEDIIMEGHLSDIKNSALPRTPEPKSMHTRTPRSRPTVSARELDALSNSKPRSRRPGSAKQSVRYSAPQTPDENHTYSTERITLTGSTTSTPLSPSLETDELFSPSTAKTKGKTSTSALSKRKSSTQTHRSKEAHTPVSRDDSAESADELSLPGPGRRSKKTQGGHNVSGC